MKYTSWGGRAKCRDNLGATSLTALAQQSWHFRRARPTRLSAKTLPTLIQHNFKGHIQNDSPSCARRLYAHHAFKVGLGQGQRLLEPSKSKVEMGIPKISAALTASTPTTLPKLVSARASASSSHPNPNLKRESKTPQMCSPPPRPPCFQSWSRPGPAPPPAQHSAPQQHAAPRRAPPPDSAAARAWPPGWRSCACAGTIG